MKSVIGIKNELKVKGSIFGFWFLVYSGFLIYSVISNSELDDDIFKIIFYFAGQGFTTFLLIWANFSQIINARQFSFTLKRYQTLVSYQMNRTKVLFTYKIVSMYLLGCELSQSSQTGILNCGGYLLQNQNRVLTILMAGYVYLHSCRDHSSSNLSL